MLQIDRPRQLLAISLSMLAGYVDAIGFLSANGYFVSFMSGNTTRFAVDLLDNWRVAVVPGLLIAGFVCGVAAGTMVSLKSGTRRKAAVIALVAAMLTISAVAREAALVPLSIAMMVLAMGAINNTFQRDGAVSIGLTYMTGALVRLGQSLGAALTGKTAPGWREYLLLWGGLLSGAISGAVLFSLLGTAALWLAAAWGWLMVIAAWRIEARS